MRQITRQTDTGLSPRVRGNHLEADHKTDGHGSIPACAGKPNTLIEFVQKDGVYPRVCGETNRMRTKAVTYSGLSPRVRGNLSRPEKRPPSWGSIPACAGKPRLRSIHPVPFRVYPRVCGETTSGQVSFILRAGLSPRVRGNR